MARRRYYKRNVVATERDRDVMRYLGEHGCASLDQIAALFWPGRQLRTCAERIDLLVKAGFVHDGTVHCRGREERIMWIARKGSQLFEQEVRAKFQTGRPARAEIAHLLHTNDAVHRIGQRASIVSLRNEHQLKSLKVRTQSQRQVADAHLTIEHAGRRYSFSLEIDGRYSGKRLWQKVQDYGASGQPIVWVVYSQQRLAHLTQLCARFHNIRPILFSSL